MQFQKIIAAIDLDDDLADGVVSAADSLARKDGAKLEIVSVWPLMSVMTPAFSTDVAVSSVVVTENVIEMHKQGRQESREKLDRLCTRLSPNAKAVILDGDPAGAVAEHAKEIDADLIVTGSHQRNFLSSIFQGSASRDLVKEAPCAVFLVTKAFAEKQAVRPAG